MQEQAMQQRMNCKAIVGMEEVWSAAAMDYLRSRCVGQCKVSVRKCKRVEGEEDEPEAVQEEWLRSQKPPTCLCVTSMYAVLTMGHLQHINRNSIRIYS